MNGIGPIRTKSRTIRAETVIPLPTKVYTYPGNVLISSSSNPFFGGTEATETIVYSTRGTGCDYRTPAYCKHTKKTRVYTGKGDDVSVVFQPVASPTQRVEYYGHHLHSRAAHDASEIFARAALASQGVKLGPAVLGSDGQAMMNQCFLDLHPDLTVAQLPNFFLEILQVKGLFQLWKRNVGLAKNLAGARLNYKFGWKPTIGDLEDCFNQLRNVSKVIAAFEKDAGVVRRRQESLLNETTTVSGTFNYDGDIHYPCSWTATVSRHVQGFLVYRCGTLEVLTNLNKTLHGFLDSIGFELNPRIIWDAVPFTFVIDWFFGIGGFLDQFKIDAVELPIICTDPFIQYKETLTVHSQLVLDRNSTVTTPETVCRPWASREDFFHRLPIMPNDDIVLNAGWRKPSGNQLINLVALATVLSKGYSPLVSRR